VEVLSLKNLRVDFSTRLRSTRELRGYTQEQLAIRVGCKPCHISHFETGNRLPNCFNLYRLADALYSSTDFLLGRV
jgi:transcriptional regulator with XRE-family HTH domain